MPLYLVTPFARTQYLAESRPVKPNGHATGQAANQMVPWLALLLIFGHSIRPI